MSSSDSIEVVMKAVEAHNQNGVMGFAESLDDSVVDYFSNGREPLRGKQAFIEDNLEFGKMVSDIQVEVTNIFGCDDWVSVQGIMTGKHAGSFQLQNGEEFPPTGRPFQMPVCNVIKVRDGKIVEIHEYFDSGYFMRQLQS